MFPCLYLDTARLGRMCPEAQAADYDFARLAGEVGCSLYFEHFLRFGFGSLPPSLARQYPGLSFWAGVASFKNDLRTVLALPRDRQVFVANRSAQLVRLAARLLCLRCENILVTDMEWPAYLAILAAECRRMGRIVTTVPVRHAIFRGGISQQELVDRLAACYRRQNCDGLLLSAVTFEGVRQPIKELVETLGEADRPRFVVVDGAQAVNHIPLRLAAEYCDLLLTGCHKWLRAYHPLGLAVCCRAATEGVAMAVCREMFSCGELDDPLWSFATQLETERLESFSETVNIAPLLTAAAAVRAMIRSDRAKQAEFTDQIDNADRIADRSSESHWRSLRQSKPLRSGILLLEAAHAETRSAPPDRVRQRFLSSGIALTVYPGGILRASLPSRSMSGEDRDVLHSALSRWA